MSNSKAGGGGVLRGNEGEWIKGFSFKAYVPAPTITEVRAIVEGLKICWALGIHKIIVESVAKLVIEAINQRRQIAGCRELLCEIEEMQRRGWQLIFNHVYREGNRSAHCMARVSLKQREETRIWETPPSCSCQILKEEAEGLEIARRITY